MEKDRRWVWKDNFLITFPVPVLPKIFEIWSRSRNYLFNKYLLHSVWRMLGRRKTYLYKLYYTSIGMVPVLLLSNSFKGKYVAGAGEGAKMRGKGGAGAKNK